MTTALGYSQRDFWAVVGRVGLAALGLLFSLTASAQTVLTSLKGTWPGYPRGGYDSVFVVGNHAYAVGSGGLAIFDMSKPAAVVRRGGFDTSGRATAVHVVGNLAYVADEFAGLQIIDVSNPAAPVLRGRFGTRSVVAAVRVAGATAYLADGDAGLRIIDVSEPAAPVLRGRFATKGSARAVEVAGDLAYVVDSGAGLQIVDVSDPTAPSRQSGVATSGFPVSVRVTGNLAFVAYVPGISVPGLLGPKDGGLLIVDVSNPASPVVRSDFKIGEFSYYSAPRVAVSGRLVYVAHGTRVEIIDVSDPTAPVRRSGFEASDSISQIQVIGNLAYVALGDSFGLDGGLAIFDVSDPTAIARLGGFNTRGFSAAVSVIGDLAYVADGDAGLQILDISRPAPPAQLGGLDEDIGWSVSVRVVKSIAYVASFLRGLQIIDVSNPAKPVRRGAFGDSDFTGAAFNIAAYAVEIVGNQAYVTDFGGFRIIDVSNPAAPMLRGGFDTGGLATDIEVVGNMAYVANGKAGLQIIDVADPSKPVRRGEFPTSGNSQGVQIVGNFAYVADGEAGLQIIDVSNPAVPARRGGFDTSGDARGVQVVGNLAYVADGEAGLQIIDVSDPAAPAQRGNFDTKGFARDVQVVGNLAYVADDNEGLTIIELATVLGTPPVITRQPKAAATTVGGSVAFSFEALSSLPMAYQWKRYGTEISGATNANLVLNNIKPSDQGLYSVVVRNSAGLVESENAQLVLLRDTAEKPGSVDPSFDLGTGISGTTFPVANTIAIQPDGKMLVGGSFTNIDGKSRNGLARLNSDGSLDRSFLVQLTGTNPVHIDCLALLDDGKIVIAGAFNRVNGVARNGLARLYSSGALDNSFDSGAGVGTRNVSPSARIVYSLREQPDGKLLIAGSFTNFNGVTRNGIVRVNVNGSVDTSFNPATVAVDDVFAMALQNDGKVLIGGVFPKIDGTARSNIARLNTDGSNDKTFPTPRGLWLGVPLTIGVQPDGKILIAGAASLEFLLLENLAVPYPFGGMITRLNPDGSLDKGFNVGIAPDSRVFSVAQQANGQILIGGDFGSVAGIPRKAIARLNRDGSLDANFKPLPLSGRPDSVSVNAVAIEIGGRILIGGGFSGGILRLDGGDPTPGFEVRFLPSPRPLFDGRNFPLTLQGEPRRTYAIEASTNLLTWTLLQTITVPDTADPTGREIIPIANLTDIGASKFDRRFYRARLIP